MSGRRTPGPTSNGCRPNGAMPTKPSRGCPSATSSTSAVRPSPCAYGISVRRQAARCPEGRPARRTPRIPPGPRAGARSGARGQAADLRHRPGGGRPAHQSENDRIKLPAGRGQTVLEASRVLGVLRRSRIPVPTRVRRRAARVSRGAPVRRTISSNRRLPRNTSRTARRAHFSPTISSVRAMEQTLHGSSVRSRRARRAFPVRGGPCMLRAVVPVAGASGNATSGASGIATARTVIPLSCVRFPGTVPIQWPSVRSDFTVVRLQPAPRASRGRDNTFGYRGGQGEAETDDLGSAACRPWSPLAPYDDRAGQDEFGEISVILAPTF